jgi:hypothetical protein
MYQNIIFKKSYINQNILASKKVFLKFSIGNNIPSSKKYVHDLKKNSKEHIITEYININIK